MQNHFDLFQLPRHFALDLRALDRAYHEIQGRVHPDKFAHATDAEKRVAMQWATRANEAYRTLKDPLKRARYLCELNGVDLQIESNTAMPREFLMQQMEWREALDDAKAAKDISALEKLNADLDDLRSAEIGVIGKLLDREEFHPAALAIRKLMFLDKFADEVGLAFEMHC